MSKKKFETNQQFLQRIMRYSRYGALAEFFVMDALAKFASHVAVASPADLEGSIVHGEAWIGVAREIQEKIKAHLNDEV